MSEFWKKRSPRLTDEEERALWERVRTMPSEAAGARRRSPWAALWAKPAVRFGAPVFAVALVAVVWVAQRSPEAPRPERAATMQVPGADAPVAGNSAPANEAERAPAASLPAEPEARRGRRDAPISTGELKTQAGQPSREGVVDGRDEAVGAKEEAQTFAAPPAAAPAPAPEQTKVTVIKGGAEDKRAMAKSSSPETSAALGAADVTAQRVIAPAPPALHASRVASLRSGEYFGELCEDVMRPETARDAGAMFKLPYRGKWVSLERRAGVWRLNEDLQVPADAPPVPQLRERRGALAVELHYAIQERDSTLVRGVHEAALALQRQRPRDEGVGALVKWAAAAITALEEN